ncbi:MAG: SGNH/GDSL hydrolase family protein [Candidatus Niameybacter stercoravium]|nr:SGNH/GDSL hydrolase family protein [Candidatus Niameybacter stercoravium]
MFNLESGNTWIFIGGSNAEGGWAQTKGARNFIGHFEEHIRWEKRNNDYVGTRERYTINTGRVGQTLEAINQDFYNLVEVYQPRAVALFVGKEEYEKGPEGLEAFEENLRLFFKQVKDMQALLFLQTPAPPKEEAGYKQAEAYAQVMRALAKEEKEILIIDHFHLCIEKGLSYTDGQLDANGHLEIAKQFSKATIGDFTPFALREEVVEHPSTYAAWEKVEEDPYAKEVKALVEGDKENPLRWLFLGDSITHGALHTHGYDSFPQLLEKYIRGEMGRRKDVFINTAVSGATTKDQLQNHKARFKAYKEVADIVMMMFGTNDCVSDVSVEDYKHNLKKIIRDVKAVGAIPILRAPNPCMDAPGGRGSRLIPYIEVIEECAKEEGLILIHHYNQWMQAADENPELIKRGGWVAKGDESSIHPGAAGHLNMFHMAIRKLGISQGSSEMMKLVYKI